MPNQQENLEPQMSQFYGESVQDSNQEVQGQVTTDDDLEAVVKELLHNSRNINARDITVNISKGDVTLRGTVKSDEEKYTAGSLAQLVHGIGNIKNELIVKLNEGILPSDIGRKG